MTSVALVQDDAAFRAYADGLPIIVWQQNALGTICFTNAEWRRVTGLQDKSSWHMLEPWMRITHPDDLDRVVEALRSAVLERARYEFEWRAKRPDEDDDAYRWYLARGTPQFRDGEFIGWIGCCVDIHHSHVREEHGRAAAQAARLHELSHTAETAFEAWRLAADRLPMLLFTARPDGEIEFINARWKEMTGHGSGENADATWWFAMHPDDFERVAAAWATSLTTGERFDCEFRFLKSDGGTVWVYCSALPHVTHSGIERWYGACVNIEKRIEAQNALAESERRLQALADAIPVMVWTADASGWIDWYNKGWFAFTGQTPEEAAGWGWQAAHHPDDFHRVMQQWPHCIATGEPFEMEFRLRRADGVYRTVLSRAVPVRNTAGAIVRWYGSHVEIEAQKEALQRSERVAEVLQSAFLPAHLPQTQVLRVDAVYQPSDKDALVGGDWFDAVQLPSGEYLLSIGDVTGHGLSASVIAARMRHAIIDFALSGEDPASVLHRANHILRFEHPEIYATAIVACVDASCSTFVYASAGHCPPIFAPAADRTAKILPCGGLPLGVEPHLNLKVHCIAVDRDDVVALYTDGVTEFARDWTGAEERLMAAVARVAADPSMLRPASFVRDAVLQGARTVDDAALLVVQFSQGALKMPAPDGTPRARTWRFHASNAHIVHAMRAELIDFVRRFTDDAQGLFETELVLGELVTNTMKHAPGLVEVRIDCSAHEPIVTVLDSGPGLRDAASARAPDPLDEHGRGLFIVKSLSPEISVARALGGGTELRVVLPLRVGTFCA